MVASRSRSVAVSRTSIVAWSAVGSIVPASPLAFAATCPI